MLKHIVLALCMFNAIHASALQYDTVIDDVNLLSPATTAEIRGIGNRLNAQGKVQFTVKIVADCKDTLLDGRQFFNATGIGDKIKNNGLLLYINALNFKAGRPNKVRLLTGYGMEGMFNDAKCGRILDAGLAEKTVDAKVLVMVKLIDKEFKALGDEQPPAKAEAMTPSDMVKIAICILLGIALFVIIAGLASGGGSDGGGVGGVVCAGTGVLFDVLGSAGSSRGSSGGSSGGGGFGGGSCGGGGAGR